MTTTTMLREEDEGIKEKKKKNHHWAVIINASMIINIALIMGESPNEMNSSTGFLCFNFTFER